MDNNQFKIIVEAGVDIQKSKQNVNEGIKSVGKTINPIDIPFQFNLKDSGRLKTELEKYKAQILGKQGQLIDFKINTSNVFDKDLGHKVENITGAVLKYKNQLNEVITTELKWAQIGTQTGTDGKESAIMGWTQAASSYQQNIEKVLQTNERLIEQEKRASQSKDQLIAKMKLLNEQALKANIGLNSENQANFDKAINTGDLKDAQHYMAMARVEFQQLNAIMSKGLPENAIENLNKKIFNMDTGITMLGNKFKTLGNAMPQGLDARITDMKNQLVEINKTDNPEERIKKYNALSESVQKLNNEYKVLNQETRIQNKDLQLDLNKANLFAKIEAWVKNNGKAIPDFGDQIDNVKSKINSADGVTLKNLDKQFSTITKRAQTAGVTGDTFLTKIQKNIVQFARFMISATVSMTVINSFRMLITNVVELDKSLTELLKVADLSGASLDQFKQKAFELGSQIGRTGKEVIDAVTTFKRAGYSINQSLDLSKAALTMTNVGDGIDNVSEASSALISVLKGFKFDDSQAMRIVDAINETSNNAAIDFDNITEGLRRVSGTLSQTGTSLEQTIGLLTGGFGQLRDIESVSSGLVIISQRLRGIDEDGQAIEGLAPKLQKQFKEIANIDIEDANGELRSTYDIVADMARVLPTLTSKQRQYLAELAAGNRQVKTLNAILGGWKDVEAAVDSATNSLGSADKENAAFMNSIQGRMNAFRSAFQKLSDNTINSEWIKKIVNLGTGLVNLVDTIGLLNIAVLGGLVWAVKLPMVISAITAAVTALGTALGISTGGASFLFAGLAALVLTIGTDLLNSTNAVNDAFLEQQQIVDDLTTKVSGLKSKYDSLKDKQNRTPEEDQRLALLKEELSTQEALLKIEKQRAFDQQYGKKTVEFKGAFGYTETTDYNPLDKIKYDIQAYQDTLNKISNTSNLDDFDQLNEKLLNQKQTLINTNSELLSYKDVLGQLPPEFEEILNSLNDIIITENAISDNSNVFEFTDIISTTSDELESSANSAINSLLSTTVSMLKQRYQEADDAEKKYYQKRLDRQKKAMEADKKETEEFYDNKQDQIKAQLDLLKAQKATDDYQKNLGKKQDEASKIQAQIDALQFDTSEAGNKLRNQLKDQLNDANSDIEDLQYDRKNELIEDTLNNELDRIQKQKDAELEEIEETYKARIDSLEKQLQNVTDNAMSEADIRNEAFELINQGGQQLYNDLIAYNRQYGETRHLPLYSNVH